MKTLVSDVDCNINWPSQWLWWIKTVVKAISKMTKIDHIYLW